MPSAIVRYPHRPDTGRPMPLDAATIWAVATALRRDLLGGLAVHPVPASMLAATARDLVVNDRPITLCWDLAHAVHDEDGHPVLGVCESDPETPGQAFISLDAGIVAGCDDLAASTAAHELGHAVFDIPATLPPPEQRDRRYRTAIPDETHLTRPDRQGERWSEFRANELMGAFLVPPMLLHAQLLQHARAEGLALVHRPHRGRRGFPVVRAGSRSDTVAGIATALAGDFGVSERFIHVRLDRHRLIVSKGERS